MDPWDCLSRAQSKSLYTSSKLSLASYSYRWWCTRLHLPHHFTDMHKFSSHNTYAARYQRPENCHALLGGIGLVCFKKSRNALTMREMACQVHQCQHKCAKLHKHWAPALWCCLLCACQHVQDSSYSAFSH